MDFLNLIIENGDSIVAAIGASISAIIGILTLVNRLMPEVITNKTLAKIEFVTSKLSLGTKKAEIKK